jgi:tetratricopeptide (TPR) repeat protein
VVHRDLKPENVFVCDDGRVAVLDLGLARLLDTDEAGPGGPDLTETGAQLGTLLYMAPEQHADPRAAGPAADVYAIGAILFETATGRAPFLGDAAAVIGGHASRRPPRPSELEAAVPAALDELILRCLAKDPAARPAPAERLAEELERAASAPAAPSGTARAAEPAAGRSTHRAVALLALVTRDPSTRVALLAGAEAGQLERAGGERHLAAFPRHPSAAAGIEAARRVAARARHELALVSPPVIHVAELRVRERGDRVLVLGDALDDPGWADAVSGERVILTPAAARVAERRGGGAAELPPLPHHHTPLVGRDALLAALAQDRARPGPTLTTLIGEAGHGLTRLLIELERLTGGRRVSGRERLDAVPAVGVLLVDDVDQADDATLAALERAAAAPGRPLWIVAAARPSLLERRPSWGLAATASARHAVDPLDDGAGGALLRALLHPVELVPDAVSAALLEGCRGVPLLLFEVVNALRAGGAIRRQPGGDGWFLAADDLLLGSATPLALRLAERALAGSPPALAALARRCALLGDTIDAALVEHVERALARGEDALDVPEALARLGRAGILAGGRFPHPLLRRALAATIAPDEAARIHRAALAAVRGRASAEVARHAAACGEHDEAFAAWLDVATAAAGDAVAAERAFGAALAQLADDDPRREAALAGRARARTRLQRFAEARDDLRAARAHAAARGDERATAGLMLDEATVVDWCTDWAGAAALVAEALPRCARAGDPALAARARMAEGRTAWRAERVGDAIVALGAAAADPAADDETRAIALILLAPALVVAGRLDEAERRYDEAIACCRAAGDDFHLAAAHMNRLMLWIKRQELDRAVADQETAIAIARELGNASMELIPTFNLAELLHWSGDHARAAAPARRARELQLRLFGERPLPDETLLLARILVASAERDEARRLLAFIDERCDRDAFTPSARVLRRLVELAVERPASPEPWQALVDEARSGGLVDERLEVLLRAAHAGLPEGARWAAEGLAAAAAPHWRRQFEDATRMFRL